MCYPYWNIHNSGLGLNGYFISLNNAIPECFYLVYYTLFYDVIFSRCICVIRIILLLKIKESWILNAILIWFVLISDRIMDLHPVFFCKIQLLIPNLTYMSNRRQYNTLGVERIDRCFANDILTHWPLGDLNWILGQVVFKQRFVIDGWDISHEIARRRISLDLTDEESTLLQVMVWCHQATSHYLGQCWPRMTQYGVTRPLWIKVHFLEWQYI